MKKALKDAYAHKGKAQGLLSWFLLLFLMTEFRKVLEVGVIPK